MASIFGHTIVAVGITALHKRDFINKQVLSLGILSSVIPDIDVFAYNFGIYQGFLAHRGFTHSPIFALFWSVLLIFLFHFSVNKKHKLRLGFYYFICMLSHGLIDGFTTGGDGICYFLPFSSERASFPWKLIEVSPIGAAAFFSEWGLRVLKSEFLYLAIPSVILMGIGKLIHRDEA